MTVTNNNGDIEVGSGAPPVPSVDPGSFDGDNDPASSLSLHSSLAVPAAEDRRGGLRQRRKRGDNSSSKVEENDGGGGSLKSFSSQSTDIARYQQLASDPQVLKWSLYAVRFGMFATALSGTILDPNYPVMVTPGGDPDSFPSTKPFAFNSATYFIPLCANLGRALAGLTLAKWSDRAGRKIFLVLMPFGGAVGALAKWFCRRSFWAFCAANFITGFVSANEAVSLAYASDVFVDRKQKEAELAIIVSLFVIGLSGGGIIAILMQSSGLFSALWVAAGIQFLATAVVAIYTIEPSKELALAMKPAVQDDDEEEDAPTEVDRRTLWNIIIGALLDSVGSTGLMPLALSPLAFTRYYLNFETNNLTPILSLTGYKWLSVLLAFTVLPTTVATPNIFAKFGVGTACVFGNLLTAILTIALLLVVDLGPATRGMFALFVIILYSGFPLTVISQLTTGPMLDRITPPEKRGAIQGVNSTVNNLAGALAPWLLGILADQTTDVIAVWVTIGVSFLAAVGNAPLMFHKALGPTRKKKETEALIEYDEETEKRLRRGSWIPPALLHQLNDERIKNGQPLLVQHFGTYEKDKPKLGMLRKYARDSYEAFSKSNYEHLAHIATHREDIKEITDMLAKSTQADQDEVDQVYDELGKWFTDHLRANGYQPQYSAILMKQMILSAFPTLTTEEISSDNLEQTLVNIQALNNQFLRLEDDNKYSLSNVLITNYRPERIWVSSNQTV